MDFAENFLAEEDFDHFKNSFNLEAIKDYKKDILVKNGGLQAMLACFLKNNKSILKKFKGGDDKEKSKKRPRANSNVSAASSSKKKDKKAKDKKKKKSDD